jgi:hypothetical protein
MELSSNGMTLRFYVHQTTFWLLLLKLPRMLLKLANSLLRKSRNSQNLLQMLHCINISNSWLRFSFFKNLVSKSFLNSLLMQFYSWRWTRSLIFYLPFKADGTQRKYTWCFLLG